MSNAVALTSPLDRFDEIQVPKAQWDEKQLVAALERASLLELQKVLKVQPIKAAQREEEEKERKSRGRRAPMVAAAAAEMANISLTTEGEEERMRIEVNGEEVEVEMEMSKEEVMRMVNMYAKIKVVEEVARQTGENIEVNMAPVEIKDQVAAYVSAGGKSSFNIINLGLVVDKYHLWRTMFPRIQPFYAVKSNPDAILTRTLHVAGTGFDCASKVELEQVLCLPGINTEDIIFANPCKQVEHILYAKEKGVSMMTFDNPYELEKIKKHFPEARLVLRLLPDDSHSLMPFGSKFGASITEATQLIAQCQQMGMSLIGVSFHVGSGCFSSIAWVEALKLARQIFDTAMHYGYEMTLVDIGGGFPGLENCALPLSTIGPEVAPIADALFPPHVRIISEPGRFFCTQSTTLACTIVSKRERMVAAPPRPSSGTSTPSSAASSSSCSLSYSSPALDAHLPASALEPEFQLYLSDGIYGSMNCVVFDHAILQPLPLFSCPDRPLQRTTMWGPTCDSIDVVVKGVPFPDSHVGEWIYFENMGAYTSAAASSFNGFAPPSPYYVLNP